MTTNPSYQYTTSRPLSVCFLFLTSGNTTFVADDLGIAVAAGITKKSSAVHWLLSLVKGIVHNFFLL